MPPTTDELKTLIDGLTARVRSLETVRVAQERRIAELERAPNLGALTSVLQRLVEISERRLAADNQLGTLLAGAEQLQATLSTPKTPWVPT